MHDNDPTMARSAALWFAIFLVSWIIIFSVAWIIIVLMVTFIVEQPFMAVAVIVGINVGCFFFSRK